MALNAEALEEMFAAGLTGDQIVRIARALEATSPATVADDALSRKRERDAARMRAKREQERQSRDVAATSPATSEQKSPPRPPKKTSPPSPPKGGSSPTAIRDADTPSLDELTEQVWSLQPKRYRRSTRPDVRQALEHQLRKATHTDVLAACRAYYRLPDSTKADGEFAMGAAKLLKAGRWRDFLPRPEPPAKPADAAVHAARVQHYRDTGEWREPWGPRPTEKAA